MREPPSAPRRRPPLPRGAAAVHVRVVLADDSPDFRSLIELQLGSVDDVELVASVDDGEAAIRAVDEHAPHVALLDVSMPGMDGLEAARRVREADPSVRVVMLTGHTTEAVADAARAAGAVAVVQKGAPLSELLAVLRGDDAEPPTVG